MNKLDKIYLITKADDIGSNDSANRAFYDGYTKGVLRNGVIMITCGAAKEAAEFFKEEKGFSTGLHLTMNAEWDNVKWGPVLPSDKVPSLVDKSGYFFQTTKALHDNKPKLEEFIAEAQAQLDLAREYGLDIKFADCHMMFCWVLEGLEEELKRWCERNSIIFNLGDFQWLPQVQVQGNAFDRIKARLKAAEPGIYQIHMGHPAYDTPEMRNLGHTGYPGNVVAEEREWDRLAIMDESIAKFFEENNVIPITLEEAMNMK